MNKEYLVDYFYKLGGMLNQQQSGWTITWSTAVIPSISGRTLSTVWKSWKSWVEDETLELNLLSIIVSYYKSAPLEEMQEIQSWIRKEVFRLPKLLQDAVDAEMSYIYGKYLTYHWRACSKSAVDNINSYSSAPSFRLKLEIAIIKNEKRKLSENILIAPDVDKVRASRL